MEPLISLKDEWYTPAWITDPLGHFDLDPAAPIAPHRQIADREYTKADDGLSLRWEGRVWLNPPFSHPALKSFVGKMAEHGDGIMLLLCRGFDTGWFQDDVLGKADALLLMRGRVRFIRPDGKAGKSAPLGTLLAAYGKDNARVLQECGLPGKYVPLK